MPFKVPLRGSQPNSSEARNKPTRSLKDEEYKKIFDAVVLSGSLAAAAPEKPTLPSKVFRAFPKRQLAFENLTQDPEISEDEIVAPTQREMPRTPVFKALKRKVLNYDETPVSRRQMRPEDKPVPQKSEKENINLESVYKTPVSSQSPGSQPKSSQHSSSSYRSAISDVQRKSPFLDISNTFRAPSQPTSQEKTPSSQASTGTTYSLPASQLTPAQKMEWLLLRRMVGTWVQCDQCKKWRYLKDEHDPSRFPDVWKCSLSPDPEKNTCETPEQRLPLKDEALMISNAYAPGSLVWAQVASYPWWPAIVDDDPDYEQFYWFDDGATEIPTQYHVVFFDSNNNPVSRAWVPTDKIQPFEKAKEQILKGKPAALWASRLYTARKKAEEAQNMEQLERLKQHGFLARYKDKIGNLNAQKAASNKKAKSHKTSSDRSASKPAAPQPNLDATSSDVEEPASPASSVSTVY